MSQKDIDRAVANATGEKVAFIQKRGFSIANSLRESLETEVREPLVLDWDSMSPVELAN